jgi:hypothetical protein
VRRIVLRKSILGLLRSGELIILNPTIGEAVLVNKENHHFADCKGGGLSEVANFIGQNSNGEGKIFRAIPFIDDVVVVIDQESSVFEPLRLHYGGK